MTVVISVAIYSVLNPAAQAGLLWSYQVLVPELLPLCITGHYPHLVSGVKLSPVVPALELGHVPMQVLGTHLVIGPGVAPFQHRPEGLHAVGTGLFPHILPH